MIHLVNFIYISQRHKLWKNTLVMFLGMPTERSSKFKVRSPWELSLAITLSIQWVSMALPAQESEPLKGTSREPQPALARAWKCSSERKKEARDKDQTVKSKGWTYRDPQALAPLKVTPFFVNRRFVGLGSRFVYTDWPLIDSSSQSTRVGKNSDLQMGQMTLLSKFA